MSIARLSDDFGNDTGDIGLGAMRRSRFVLLGLVLLTIGAVVSYFGPLRQPNFNRILALSGLPFSSPPAVVRWYSENSGPFGADQVTLVEFEIADKDRVLARSCAVPNFRKGIPPGTEWFRGFAGAPADLAEVCWALFNQEGQHFFAVFGRTLVYRLVLM